MSRTAEAASIARQQILAAADALCPGIVGNPFLPHWPYARQMLALGAHLRHPVSGVFQMLYGGAAMGGKSDWLLMSCAQYAWQHGDFAAVCFRRTYSDLILPGAMLDRAMEWWIPAGARWDGTSATFRFPSGAKVTMSYLSKPNDHLRYASTEFHLAAFDELTHWPTSAQYEFVGLSRVRRKVNCKIPLRCLAASNPGGPGHEWVRREFIGGPDPATGRWRPPRHLFIPARIQDNPHADQRSYIASLSRLHPTVREQLLNGDWSARDPGDYFRAEWFGPLLDPQTEIWPSSQCIRVRWWDLAASEKEDAARTAGVRMARHRSGVRAVEHCRAFRATPGTRDDLIFQTAKADGHGVFVGLEIEGGSGGIAQFNALEKRLRAAGFRVVGARPRAELTDREARHVTRQLGARAAKAQRADPVASCVERGYQRRGEGPSTGGQDWGVDAHRSVTEQRDGIRLFSGPWTQDFLDECMGFPIAETCDVVDALSGAWAWLEAHPAGFQVAPPTDREDHAGDSHDVHPEDRDAGDEALPLPNWPKKKRD